MSEVAYLIVGLGNPGLEYSQTRHNIGFMIADLLAERHGIEFTETSCASRWGIGTLGELAIALAKPTTYMNRSGRAVDQLLCKIDLSARELVVVYDDLDLDFGQIRVRTEGGSGGHKGVESIIADLDRDDFARIRVGISRPTGRMDPADYVLSPFEEHETEELGAVLEIAVDAVELLLAEGAERAMQKYNKRA